MIRASMLTELENDVRGMPDHDQYEPYVNKLITYGS